MKTETKTEKEQPQRRNPVYWRDGVDPDDALWVCSYCGAELHADCVGDVCPACGARADEAVAERINQEQTGSRLVRAMLGKDGLRAVLSVRQAD